MIYLGSTNGRAKIGLGALTEYAVVLHALRGVAGDDDIANLQ